MPRLPTSKHPEFSRRNAMVISCVGLESVDAAMEKFDLSARRIYQIVREYKAVGPSYKWIKGKEATRILRLYKKHRSTRAVGRIVGRDAKTIKRFLKRRGVTLFRNGWKGHK